jgi:hypothetical protein
MSVPGSLVPLGVALWAGTASAAVNGAATYYASPGDTRESCIAITHAPDGTYSDDDIRAEASLCSIDFYSGNYGLCPKTFSTSPGTLVYDISSGEYAGRAADFETEHCRARSIATSGVRGEPVSFKMTMNAQTTSATFAPASLLYYHFSRFFDTAVHVPVAVWRSMDREEHFRRVVSTGVEVSAGPGSSAMNRDAWRILAEGARDPSTYRPTAELYTDDGRQIFGVLLRSDGRRYGAEINGTRRSGWGAGQNRDFQNTAPFLALRHEGPLADAIDHGLETASLDPDLREAMPDEPSAIQMAFWMTELAEIVLLDFIFSQQDRVGNIDYIDYWYWVDEGVARRQRARGSSPPPAAAGLNPIRIRRSVINDNDAGGRVPYANYSKTTGMVDNLRHISPKTYQRLQRLAHDFRRPGPIHDWLVSSFGISERQVAQIVGNTVDAAERLAATCRAGGLRFSLDPEAMLATGSTKEHEVPCAAN